MVGSWNDALEKSNVVVDDNLNPNVTHGMMILRQYACNENDVANMKPRVYTDEEDIEVAISYLKNRSTAIEERFTKMVSKTTKKNLKKGFMFITPALTGLTHELALSLFHFLLFFFSFWFPCFLSFRFYSLLGVAFCHHLFA